MANKGPKCPLDRRIKPAGKASTKPPKRDMSPICSAFHNRFNGSGKGVK